MEWPGRSPVPYAVLSGRNPADGRSLRGSMYAQRPEAVGLYDPTFEHDACGVGAVADLSGEPTHETVRRALDVLVDSRVPGPSALAVEPVIRQVIVGAPEQLDRDAFERKLYVTRRIIEKAAGPDLAIPSFSSRTIVYKGMLTSPQLRRYFPDLRHELTASALALVHSRFSTNTFPSWELAHPYRLIAHNG